MKRVLDIGNCGPDHAALRQLITGNFTAALDQVDRAADAIERLAAETYSLILVNRKLDCDYSDGIEVIRAIKADERFAEIPVMMITNFAEHQTAAVEIGAVVGFGKNDLSSNATLAQLQEYLG